MKKNIFVILLATFTTGLILADENGGFLSHLGEGVKDIIESPANNSQGRKKKKKEMKEQERKDKEAEKKKQQPANRRQARRQRRHSDSSDKE